MTNDTKTFVYITFDVLADEVRATSARASVARVEHERGEDERALVKQAAIARLMLTVDPNGKDGKFHSATSAEKIVEADDAYYNHREAQRLRLLAVDTAETEAFIARQRLTHFIGGR